MSAVFVQCLMCTCTAIIEDDLGPGDIMYCYVCNNANIKKFLFTYTDPSKKDTSADDYNRAMKGI